MYVQYFYRQYAYVYQELPGGYGRVKPDIVTYGSSVRGSALQYVLHSWVLFLTVYLQQNNS